MRQRPAEPIQTPNQKYVASVQAYERLLKAGSFRAGPGALIGEDFLGTRSTKRVELQVKALLSSGDAGISNFHAQIVGRIFGTHKPMNSLDSLTCTEKDRLRDGPHHDAPAMREVSRPTHAPTPWGEGRPRILYWPSPSAHKISARTTDGGLAPDATQRSHAVRRWSPPEIAQERISIPRSFPRSRSPVRDGDQRKASSHGQGGCAQARSTFPFMARPAVKRRFCALPGVAQRKGIPMPSTFYDYARAGFTSELLPVIPPGSKLSPRCGFAADEIGKLPGALYDEGWGGIRGWTSFISTAPDLDKWQGWNAGIGLQSRHYPGLDIDVDDQELAEAIEQFATAQLGPAPCRFGRPPRRLLVYAGSDVGKMRMPFRAGDGTDHVIEWIGGRHFYVLEGTHPKTRRPYEWRDGKSPATYGEANLMLLDDKTVLKFWAELEKFLVGQGCVVSPTGHAGGRKGGSVFQDGLLAPSIEAIERALAALPNEVDYDTWLKIGAAVKASAGPQREEEAFALWEAWSLTYPDNTPEGVWAKWVSLHAPFRVGWDYLARICTDEGDGSFFGAHEDFEALQPAPAVAEVAGERNTGPLTRMFARYVWVEALKRVCDLETGELLDREQFSVRNRHIGPPTSVKECAWAILLAHPQRLQTVKGVTYRPGAELFVEENLAGLTGRCVNQWRDPDPDLPARASDADVAVWLDHVAFVVPDERERGIVLDWLAWILRHPGEKPNWALMIGSTFEGLGKDLMLEPVRLALGADNVREIGPGDLMSNWTWFLSRTRLLIIEEMHLSERKDTMNRLKPLIASPPYTLPVNVKHQPQYEVPNLVASIFFTNNSNALALSVADRRFFVAWNESPPRDPEYYISLVAWYESGGVAKAARWLLQRDLTDFQPKGKAPPSSAKEDMRKASRSAWEAVVEDAARDGEGPFTYRVVALNEIEGWLRQELGDRGRMNRPLADLLKRVGYVELRRCELGPKPARLGGGPSGAPRLRRLYVRHDDALAKGHPDVATIRAAYWEDREAEFEVIFGGGGVQC